MTTVHHGTMAATLFVHVSMDPPANTDVHPSKPTTV